MPVAARARTTSTAMVRARRLRRPSRRRRLVTGEPVADRAHGLDGYGPLRGGELAPQVAHVDLDGVRAHVEVLGPHGVEDLLAGEHLAGMAQKVGQEVEL